MCSLNKARMRSVMKTQGFEASSILPVSLAFRLALAIMLIVSSKAAIIHLTRTTL
jgi:hypothetical protein